MDDDNSDKSKINKTLWSLLNSHYERENKELTKFDNMLNRQAFKDEMLMHLEKRLKIEEEVHDLRLDLSMVNYEYKELIGKVETLRKLVEKYKNENEKLKEELKMIKTKVKRQSTTQSDHQTAPVNSPVNDGAPLTETVPKNQNDISPSNQIQIKGEPMIVEEIQDTSFATASNETINVTTFSVSEISVTITSEETQIEEL